MPYKPKFQSYKPNLKYSSNYKLPSFTPEDETRKALTTQKENLEARLAGVGIDHQNLDEVDNRGIIKKALNLDEDQGLLMSTFEILNRPNQAVLAGLTGQNFMEGLKGEVETTGIEALDHLGFIDERNVDGAGAFALNLATHIATDPLTYVGGPLAWAKKGGLIKKGKYTLKSKTEMINHMRNKSEDVLNKPLRDFVDKSKNVTYKVTDKGQKVFNENQFLNKFSPKDSFYEDVALVKKAKGSATEEQVAQSITEFSKETFGEYADDLVVAKGKTSNNLADLEIYNIVEKDGIKHYVEVGTVEVKGFGESVSSKAIGASINFNASNGNISFSPKSGLNFTSETKGLLSDTLKKLFYDDGNKLANKVFAMRNEKLKVAKQKVDYINEIINTKGLTAKLPGSKQSVNWKNAASKKAYLKKKLNAANREIENLNKLNQEFAQSQGATVESLINKLGDTKTSYTFNEQEISVLKEAIIEMNLSKFDDNFYTAVLDKHGKMKIVDIREVLKKQIHDSYINIDGKSIRFQTAIGKGVDVDVLTDLSENFMSEFISQQTFYSDIPLYKKEKGRILQWIEKTAIDEEAALRAPANVAKSLYEHTASMFKAAHEMSYQFVGAFKRIRGTTSQKLNTMNRQLGEIIRKGKEYHPEADKLLTDIIESGAKVENGKIIIPDRQEEMTTIIRNFVKAQEKGAVTTLPRFQSESALRNFETKLNQYLANQASGVNLKVKVSRSKKGGDVIQLVEGDVRDLVDNIPVNENMQEVPTMVNFGKMQISDDASKLLLSRPDLVDKYGSLTKQIQDLLVIELGYTNLPIKNYMRHTLTDEARRGMKEVSKASNEAYISAGTDTLRQRKYLGSVSEINEAVKEFGNVPYDLLDNDAFKSMEELIRVSTTKLEQHKVLDLILDGSTVHGDTLFKVFPDNRAVADQMGPMWRTFKRSDFKSEYSNLYKNLSENSQQVIDTYFSNLGATPKDAIAIHKSAHNMLKSVDRAYMDLPGIVKGYDKFLNYWKSITLVSPGFHMRNIFGNYTNSYVAGMSMPDIMRYTTDSVVDINKFKQIQNKIAQQGTEALNAADKEVFERVLDFYEMGISQTRKGIRDLELLKEAVYTQGKTAAGIKKAYNDLIKINFSIAEYIDDIQRYSLYRWAYKNKTRDVAQEISSQGGHAKLVENAKKARAQEVVSEALFDYQNLTSFEKDYMKRLFPFYTFMKNNFIYQAKNFLAKPEKYARIGRAFDYWNEDIGGIKTEDMPDYMQDRMWLALPMKVRKDDADAISFLKLNLTPSDFTELVKNPFWKGATSITAPVKMVIELGTGRDTFSGQPLQRFPGEMRRLDPEEGALHFIRDQRGSLALSANPTVQKIMNEAGLRMPQNYLSIALDGLDRVLGYKKAREFTPALMDRLSLTGTQTLDRIELTKLYQDLERMRNLQRYYEQSAGEPLPTLEELQKNMGGIPSFK